MTGSFRIGAFIFLLCGLSLPIGAQIVDRDSTKSPTIQVVSSNDLYPVLGIAAGIGAGFLADRSIQRRFQSSSLQTNHGLRNALNTAGFLGDPGAIVFSALTYFDGLAFHSRSVAALGMYTGEAVVLSGVVAETLKGIAGRSRPKLDSMDVRSFRLGRGFSNDDYGSFPSAETSIAFAAATGASLYVRRAWPGAARIVTPAAYTAATLVGLSRLYKNEHWASDVVAGAGIGIISGIAFDRWNRAHPGNVWERVFLPKAVTRQAGGTFITWAVSAP